MYDSITTLYNTRIYDENEISAHILYRIAVSTSVRSIYVPSPKRSDTSCTTFKTGTEVSWYIKCTGSHRNFKYRRTYGHRNCGPSDLWVVGLVGHRICGSSDLWVVGLEGRRIVWDDTGKTFVSF